MPIAPGSSSSSQGELGWCLAFVAVNLSVLSASIWYHRNGPHDQHKSCLCQRELKIRPSLCVLGWRVFAFLYFLSLQIYQFFHAGPTILAAFTVWNFIVCICFFGIGACLSFKAWHRGKEEVPGLMEQQPTLLARWHRIVLTIELPAAMFVATVAWGYLLPYGIAHGDTRVILGFPSFTQHGTFIWLLIDAALSEYSICGHHWTLVIWWNMIYTLFQFVLWAATGILVYPTSNPAVWSAPFVCLGFGVLQMGCFALVCVLSRCKARISGAGANTADCIQPHESDEIESGREFGDTLLGDDKRDSEGPLQGACAT